MPTPTLLRMPVCDLSPNGPARQRLLTALYNAIGGLPFPQRELDRVSAHDPAALHRLLDQHLPTRVAVTGTMERRLVVIENLRGDPRLQAGEESDPCRAGQG